MADFSVEFNTMYAVGHTIKMPVQFDRDTYTALAKLLKNNLGRWVGGKTEAWVFDYDPAELLSALQSGDVPNMRAAFQFFPTPPGVINQMLNIAIPWYGDRVLEPSAGRGDLVEGIWDFLNGGRDSIEIDTIELNPICRGYLRAKDIEPIWDDFLTYKPDPKKLYDAVYANPPFASGAYIDHIRHMVQCVHKDGYVVSVAPSSVTFATDAKTREFRQWLTGRGQIHIVEKNAFASSGTAVDTVIIHIHDCTPDTLFPI